MKQTKIIVEVSGGCVVSVYSSDPTVQIKLLDWDNVKDGNTTPQEKRAAKALEKRAKTLHVVW